MVLTGGYTAHFLKTVSTWHTIGTNYFANVYNNSNNNDCSAIGDVPAVAAIISARGRAAIDALKLMKLRSNEKNRTQSGREDHLLLN